MPEVGLSLWTVRDALGDLDRLFDRVARAGVTAIEPFGLSAPATSLVDRVARAAALRGAADRAGLRIAAVHASLPDAESVGPLAEVASTLGASTAIVAARERLVGPDLGALGAPERDTDRLNALTGPAASHGLRLGYHLSGVGPQQRVLDHLVDHLDPAIALELDVLSAQVAGWDPVALADSLGHRVRYLHVSDALPATRTGPEVPAGQGEAPLAGVIARAAPHLEVLHVAATAPPHGMTRLELVAASAAWLRLAIALLCTGERDRTRPETNEATMLLPCTPSSPGRRAALVGARRQTARRSHP